MVYFIVAFIHQWFEGIIFFMDDGSRRAPFSEGIVFGNTMEVRVAFEFWVKGKNNTPL